MSETLALAAPTAPGGVDSQIWSVERVASNALCSSGLERWRSDAAQDVHPMRDEFEVICAHTTAVSADVVQLRVSRQRASQQYPDPYMGRFSFAVQHGLGVAMLASGEPAGGDIARAAEVDLLEQAGGELSVFWRRHLPKDTSAR